MIELPEGISLAKQLNETVKGKTIANVVANASPHKFAWLSGDSAHYNALLKGKTVGETHSFGGKVEIEAEDARIAFAEGINLRYLAAGETLPKKHQLLVAFTDGSALVCTVQMYGGLWAFKEGTFDNEFYLASKQKPSPLSDVFDWAAFKALADEHQNKSAKAFLATEQRIPGLGNGVLQDILFNARVNPKTKVALLTEQELGALFQSVKTTLQQMADQGGRDIETDLYGNPGGYQTVMSKNGLAKPCPGCGGSIVKVAYMGGSVYYCPSCQKERK
ncbi:MAG TPA: endonuclease VIII [Candidatus Limiplasma sp.]|nr:endonuclease VIII [Candidatus Limiplasma sp.]HRX08379.1 endonuclease VIII [Candidatus Limiplasma sp.]